MRTKLCAELGTAHHGDIGVALQMIQAAAEAGADSVKIQHYGAVNPADPQAEWLNQSRLHVDAIATLADKARECGLEFWATPFSDASLLDLETVGVDRIKIAGTEAHAGWWRATEQRLVISWPWGKRDGKWPDEDTIHLCAIPLYPTPLECVSRISCAYQGWSDHTVGLSACLLAITNGAEWIEAHLKLPGVTTRDRDWEKTPADFRALRQFAEDVETMRTGVGQTFRDRWQKS
jgi:N,N'-diacetyllegionaminate synthase